MKNFKYLIVLLLLVLVCGLAACGEKAVNRDKAFEKVKEFISEQYQIDEENIVSYRDVRYVEVTANGTVARDDIVGNVYFMIRITFMGTGGNQYIYYNASEDKVDWLHPTADYQTIRSMIEEGELKGVYGELKGVYGELKGAEGEITK